MQRHRFYAPPAQITNAIITLDNDESHHLARVLRLPPGAVVFAFDGEGNEYECEIAQVNKSKTELNVIAQHSNEVESPLQLTLGQALIKSDKFDWVVQKATELGVTRIVPLITEHSEFRKADGHEQRLQRWRRIALEGTKQCGRRKLPEISDVQNFQQFCEQQTAGQRLIFSERGGSGIASLSGTTSVSIAIGPEGGWSKAEIDLANAQGFIALSLGNRILRTETAALAAIALVQYQLGDLP